MKRLALITALAGITIAILAYLANAAGLLDVKPFFKMGFVGLGLMIISAAYFLVTFLVEWARERDFFRRIL